MPKCKICGEKFTPKFSSFEKTCQEIDCKTQWDMSEVKKQKKPNLKLSKIKPIKKVSDKRALDNIIYNSERIKFLQLPENKICPITKQPTTDVHHMKGRIGSLLLDKRYWKALSREGHKFVEENPIWAKENGYSLNRLTND